MITDNAKEFTQEQKNFTMENVIRDALEMFFSMPFDEMKSKVGCRKAFLKNAQTYANFAAILKMQKLSIEIRENLDSAKG